MSSCRYPVKLIKRQILSWSFVSSFSILSLCFLITKCSYFHMLFDISSLVIYSTIAYTITNTVNVRDIPLMKYFRFYAFCARKKITYDFYTNNIIQLDGILVTKHMFSFQDHMATEVGNLLEILQVRFFFLFPIFLSLKIFLSQMHTENIKIWIEIL